MSQASMQFAEEAANKVREQNIAELAEFEALHGTGAAEAAKALSDCLTLSQGVLRMVGGGDLDGFMRRLMAQDMLASLIAVAATNAKLAYNLTDEQFELAKDMAKTMSDNAAHGAAAMHETLKAIDEAGDSETLQ